MRLTLELGLILWVLVSFGLIPALLAARAVCRAARWLRYRWWLLRLSRRGNGASWHERIPVKDRETARFAEIMRNLGGRL